jgi:hypothetical protein
MRTTLAILAAAFLLGTAAIAPGACGLVAGHGDVEGLSAQTGHEDIKGLGVQAGHGDIEGLS